MNKLYPNNWRVYKTKVTIFDFVFHDFEFSLGYLDNGEAIFNKEQTKK